MKTRTLFDRYIARVRKAESSMHPNQHVRAELQRVARQVRKLRSTPTINHETTSHAYIDALNKVQVLIREAQR